MSWRAVDESTITAPRALHRPDREGRWYTGSDGIRRFKQPDMNPSCIGSVTTTFVTWRHSCGAMATAVKGDSPPKACGKCGNK